MSGQTAFADAFLAGLRAGGVTDLVVSPGSRSTVVLLAGVRAGIPLHPIHDERVAGFFALGLARSGKVPALLCTSGTALGHYLPAVMEASATELPLVVVSADRPPELHGSGANQTIDQRGLFGAHLRASVDLGVGRSDDSSLRFAARAGAQAALRARTPAAGPVHVNAPARKPLEPETDLGPSPSPPRVDPPLVVPSPRALERLGRTLAAARRPLFVAGPAPVALREARGAVASLRKATGAVMVADATSQLPTSLVAGDLSATRLEPDLVVQIGRAPIGGRLERWLTSRRRVVLAGTPAQGWSDPGSSAEEVIVGDLAATLASVAQSMREAPAARWREATDQYADAVFRARETAATASFHEGIAVRVALRHWPATGRVMLGNSLPVRHADLWAAPPEAPVLHQRGVSGIDGLVAGAAGACVGADRPTLLVLGDVSFLHDLGGLSAARRASAPLVVMVVDNGGGRIFERLPVHCALEAEAFERLFAMAPAIDVSHAARTFGIPYARCEDRSGLEGALDAAAQRPGPSVVHVVAHGSRTADLALAEAIAAVPLPDGTL